MTSEWMEVSVGDVTIQVTKGTTPTTIGFGFENEGVRFIKVESLSEDGRFLEGKFAYISDEAHNSLLRSQLQEDDVLFTIAGTIGRTAIVDAKYLPANTNQAVAIIRPDKAKVSPRFLRYVLSNRAFTVSAKSKTVQSVQANYSLGELKKARFYLPTLEGQSEILSVLSPIDDRITLLRETNSTLEAIAQALFKSWFVDFSPVRAKAEGKLPEGIDEATAALFPDAFEETELGMVPQGWNLCALYDLATYINGAAYKAFEPNTDRLGLPIIKIAELKSGVTASTAYSNVDMPKKYLIETGDVLFSWSGNPDTSIDTFVWSYEAAWLNQHIFRVLPLQKMERAFVLQTLRNFRPVFSELARNKQTTGLGHVTVADLKRLLIAKPNQKILDAFAQMVGPIQEKIFQNSIQTNTLSNLRNTLLPRLISGQLRIADAETELEKAMA